MAGFEYLARLLLIFPAQTKFVPQIWETEMSKTSNIVDLLEAGLRAESLRQQVIANNIANLETPGYRSIDVRFEELLAKALDSSGAVDFTEVEAQTYQPNTTQVKSNGNDVNLETEVGKMIKNSLRHKAFIRLISKKYQQMNLAMRTSEK
jgi:flagellar basal-body rod protein FlgB